MSEIDSVMKFMREKGLSASRTALMEDVLDRADLENFLFPIGPLSPVNIPVSGGFSGVVSDDEFVSFGSPSSEFTNPYGVRTNTEVSSRSSSERLSQFGTARDCHDFDMQSDFYWYNEKEDDFAMPPHFDGHDQFVTPSEDKFIMAAEIQKPVECESVKKSISVDQPWTLSSPISPLNDINGDGITSYDESKERFSINEAIQNVNSATYKDPAPFHESNLDGEKISNSDAKCEQKYYLGGDGEEGTAEPLINDENEAEHEVFYLRIIHRKNRTGFEESKEMPIFLNSIIGGRYCITEYLGSAAFSKVVQAQDLLTGVDVCLKIIKNNKDFFDQSLDEIKLLKFVNKHDPGDERHILRLYDYFYFQEHLFIVCELLRANLYEFQKHNQESGSEPYFTLIRIQLIAKQCLEALEYLHYLGIIHCDLKPENILMKSYSRCEIKVIDLGSSCFEMDNLCLYIQSRSYRAPEVILGLPYDQKIDIWSLGCILAELCSGEVLFPNDALVMLLARMISILGPIDMDMLEKGQETHKYFTEEYDLYLINEETNQVEYLNPEDSSLEHHLPVSDSEFINFLRDLLEINPLRRPTAREALDHPWFSHQYSM